MSNEELSARLLATFITELEDQVRALGDCVEALARNRDDGDALQALFRSAHTVKGAARVAGVPVVEEICHALETRIATVRDRRAVIRDDDFALLREVVDGLNTAAALLRARQPLEGTELERLLPKLTRRGTPPEVGTVPPEPVAVSAPAAAQTAAELVRIPVEKINRLLADANALVGTTARIEALRTAWEDLRRSLPTVTDTKELRALLMRADRVLHGTDSETRVLNRVTTELASSVYGLRMRRFGEVAEGLPRALQDVAQSEGKQVELTVVGEEVEADRVVMDALREPLLHLVRNAVSHGIELPQERRAAGKPEVGQVAVAAVLNAGKLVLTVSDDGKGLDTTAIRERLTARGRVVPTSDRELARALFRAGVSTAARTTAVSGRGVGLDVVRAGLERIGGSISVVWKPRAGSTFTLEAPPSAALMRVILVSVGAHTFAFPINGVERVMRVRAEQLRIVQGRMVIASEDAATVVTSLATLLGPPLVARPIDGSAAAIVLASGADRAVVIVDELVDEDEIVLRPLDPSHGVAHVVGGALLPSGRIALVVNGGSLLQDALHAVADETILPAEADTRPPTRVLIADDSITTRTLEQSVLQAAGFEVTTAVDGQDAWDKLQSGRFDAVVADVEMPRMTGFDLCERIRASMRFAQLPVILVTGREAPEDRARGLEAGADAYIVKSSFDQSELIGTLRRLAQ